MNFQKLNETSVCMEASSPSSSSSRSSLATIRKKEENEISFEYIGDNFKSQKEYLKAIEQYNKAISLEPKNSQLICKIGLCLSLVKEYDEAIKIFVS